MCEDVDIAIIGAGAAGMMAAIWAGRTARAAGDHRRIVLLDGAKKPGAKILVAGGGRCNVTHHAVDETAYAGSTPPAIRNVLRRLPVEQTVAFFRDLGVELKREETGKLFPVTDDTRTVLNALLAAVRDAGVDFRFPWRVERITREGSRFHVERVGDASARLTAKRIVLATGGRSLPKTGSDGAGYQIAKDLGHTLTPRVFPALVPITLAEGCFLRELSGISFEATLEVRAATGKRLKHFTNSTLCTHFGLSGPCVLDISRYWIDAHRDDPDARLCMNVLPAMSTEQVDRAMLELGDVSCGRWLRERLPVRLAEALCVEAGIDASAPAHRLTRDQRKRLATLITAMPLPVTGDRGYAYAEVTAGGVALRELHLDTMESRVCPGLHLCGEICDVDGRIGGFNFQWAWASGYVAGTAVADASTPA